MEEKNRIRKLTDTTINQIAAGEVIENAASVVKELIENAIDAGSKQIHVSTLGAGMGQIIVKDDGCGMEKKELALAIERHATSKIFDAEDLFRLATLGFRGEAIASIASVSKLKIHSSTGDGGSALTVEGGTQISQIDLPRRRGTTIEVASMFYNVPARKKFQKSQTAENIEINKVMTLAALSHPEIAFSWESEGKMVWSFHAPDARMETLLGKEFTENANPFEMTCEGFSLVGHFVRSHLHRPNRTGQYLFINRRPVFSPFISQIVTEGYGTRLPSNRFPLFLLYLSCPPDLIDVNIHPRKKEVRFHEEKSIREIVLKAVRRALEEKIELPTSKISFPISQAFSLSDHPFVEKKEVFNEIKPTFQILSLLGPYVLAVSSPDEIVVIDSARARAKIYYEKWMEKENAIAVQSLLFPVTIEKSSLEAAKIEPHLPLLNEMGIGIRPFGGNSFVLEAIPEIFSLEEIEQLIDTLLGEIAGVPAGLAKKKAALIFCRSFKKKVATTLEGEKLAEELFRCKDPHLCPEGKPTFLRLTPGEMAKWF